MTGWQEPVSRGPQAKQAKKVVEPVRTRYDSLSEAELQKCTKEQLIAEVLRCQKWIKQCAVECGLCQNDAGITGFDADVATILYRKLQYDAIGPLHRKVKA